MEIHDFGYRLRELRETRNLSQSQIAAHLDIMRSTVSNYEGNLPYPSAEVLSKLAI